MRLKKKLKLQNGILLPKQKEAHGLKNVNFKISDNVLEKIIADYTRESGVRELDRQLAAIMRYQAKELCHKGKLKANHYAWTMLKKFWANQDTVMKCIKQQICPALLLALHGPMLAAIFFLLKPL